MSNDEDTGPFPSRPAGVPSQNFAPRGAMPEGRTTDDLDTLLRAAGPLRSPRYIPPTVSISRTPLAPAATIERQVLARAAAAESPTGRQPLPTSGYSVDPATGMIVINVTQPPKPNEFYGGELISPASLFEENRAPPLRRGPDELLRAYRAARTDEGLARLQDLARAEGLERQAVLKSRTTIANEFKRLGKFYIKE